MEWAWQGFWYLSNVRPQGMNGLLRIPLVEIEAYARLHSFSPTKRQDFLFYVSQMDDAFMAYVQKKREQEERIRENKPRKPARRR